MRYFVTLGAREIPVDVTPLSSGGFDVFVDGKRVSVDAVPVGGALSLRIDGRVVDVVLDGRPPEVGFAALGRSGGATVETDRSRADPLPHSIRGARMTDFVAAPMPGRIVRVLVSAGDRVEAGAPLIVIEAMKMENELRAIHAGTVAEIIVRPGDAVEGGAKLIRLDDPGKSPAGE
jgi:glutaconyl-CoA/methylmalonyl-CoA decarboxylase subunit gamma